MKVGDLVRFKRGHTRGVRWRETAVGLIIEPTAPPDKRGRWMTCALWNGKTKPEFYYAKDLEVVCENR